MVVADSVMRARMPPAGGKGEGKSAGSGAELSWRREPVKMVRTGGKVCSILMSDLAKGPLSDMYQAFGLCVEVKSMMDAP
jgi:hypothetical protein